MNECTRPDYSKPWNDYCPCDDPEALYSEVYPCEECKYYIEKEKLQ